MKGIPYDLFFRSQTREEEDLHQKGTIYIPEPKSPKGTIDVIVRHGTIIWLLLVVIRAMHFSLLQTKCLAKNKPLTVLSPMSVTVVILCI